MRLVLCGIASVLCKMVTVLCRNVKVLFVYIKVGDVGPCIYLFLYVYVIGSLVYLHVGRRCGSVYLVTPLCLYNVDSAVCLHVGRRCRVTLTPTDWAALFDLLWSLATDSPAVDTEFRLNQQ